MRRSLRIERFEERALLASIAVTNLNSSGTGSLRQAIITANAVTDLDDIVFTDLSGIITISGTPLPAVTGPVRFRGDTAAGYAAGGAPKIEIRRGNLTDPNVGNGLFFDGSASNISEVIALAITGFPEDGIHVSSDNVDARFKVRDSYIGVDLTGAARGNLGDGIELWGDTTGTFYDEIADNLISANGSSGIWIHNTQHVDITGNRIGTTPSGNGALGNGGAGAITFAADLINIEDNTISANGSDGTSIGNADQASITNNRIGTTTSGLSALPNAGDGVDLYNSTLVVIEANTISGNSGNGIDVSVLGAHSNQILGNNLGVAADGLAPLGNGQNGILFRSQAHDNYVFDNTIAHNGAAGIALPGGAVGAAAGADNRLKRNRIYSNGGLGIDLDVAGPTLNDSNDADPGPNDLQNFPVILNAVRNPLKTPPTTKVSSLLQSVASADFTVEFFTSTAADVSGFGEGATFVQESAVRTDSTGRATTTVTNIVGLSVGDHISAIASESMLGAPNDGSTSEFSVSVAVVAPSVVGQYVFYNNSAFDGNNAAADAADDAAIATDKTALLPGQTASIANYTSFSKGINGVMIDAFLPTTAVTESDFIFRVGNNNTPGSWTNGPSLPASAFTIRPGAGAGGSDRVTIIFPDGVIVKKWLQVTMLSNLNTGLPANQVFYFGNAIGESGNSTTDAVVNASDEIGARTHPHGPFPTAPIGNLYDFNRDRLVNATDQIIARTNSTNPLTALRLITVPSESGPGGGGSFAVFAPEVGSGSVASGNVTITLGNYSLLPNTPNQTIEVFVTGGDPVMGVNFMLQVGDGGPERVDAGYGTPGVDGPAIAGIDLSSGTIFGTSGTQINTAGIQQIAFASLAMTSGSVAANGKIATVTFDTTGIASGTYDFKLGGVLYGSTLGTYSTDFGGVPATIVNGTLTVTSGGGGSSATSGGGTPPVGGFDRSTGRLAFYPGADIVAAALTLSNFWFDVSSDGENWTPAPVATGLAVTMRNSPELSDLVSVPFTVGAITEPWVRARIGTNHYAHTSGEVYVLASYESGQTAQAATVIAAPAVPDPTLALGTGRKKRR